MGHKIHPKIHAYLWTFKLVFRLPHLWSTSPFFACLKKPVPIRLVPGIGYLCFPGGSGDKDPQALFQEYAGKVSFRNHGLSGLVHSHTALYCPGKAVSVQPASGKFSFAYGFNCTGLYSGSRVGEKCFLCEKGSVNRELGKKSLIFTSAGEKNGQEVEQTFPADPFLGPVCSVRDKAWRSHKNV